MAAVRANPRTQVGSISWISEERVSAQQIVEAEAEEFVFSARNEVDWLNEHMAEIFSENQVNVAEIFKTPGRLRGKTPRTGQKLNLLERRAPLSDVFSATPRGAPSPFRQAAQFDRPVSKFKVAEDDPGNAQKKSEPKAAITENQFQPKPNWNNLDSGYHGSQSDGDTESADVEDHQATPKAPLRKQDILEVIRVDEEIEDCRESDEGRTTEGSFISAKEEQTRHWTEDLAPEIETTKPNLEIEQADCPTTASPVANETQVQILAQNCSPKRPTSLQISPQTVEKPDIHQVRAPVVADGELADAPSPSDASSPIRPIVRKSSLNFASLPAREPLTTKKSIGSRVSRTSQLDQTRSSYYGRPTGEKSLGIAWPEAAGDDGMDIETVDKRPIVREDSDGDSKMARLHSKTSTQRLQDQISRLGQSQSNTRPASKSIASSGIAPFHAIQQHHGPTTHEPQQKMSPQRTERQMVAPGAFPEDEEDSWIGPSTTAPAKPSIFSPRHEAPKVQSDSIDSIRNQDGNGGMQLNIAKRGEDHKNRSPRREPIIQERTTANLGLVKSVSTSVLRSPRKAGDSPENKGISVSNPNPVIGMEDERTSSTPPKSPSRSYKGSPLKAAKDKFSSILKTSRGLFASSAAVSAEAKTSTLSPPSGRVALHAAPSLEDVLLGQTQDNGPSNSTHEKNQQSYHRMMTSPSKASLRKTRASAEREERRNEEAKEAKEAKEAQKMTDQLEKARSKVKDDARQYHLEQERLAAIQKQLATRKEHEKLAIVSHLDMPRATRSSPRKNKAQLETEGIAAAAYNVEDVSSKDVEMSDASLAMPPPAIPRPKSQVGRPGAKRPLKPAKEPLTKAKPPTVIRVDTGSQRGHQYHPSNVTLAASLQDSLAPSIPTVSSQSTLRTKASNSSIQSKASTSSFRSAATKALESAARKREQDELAAQRKREAKLEVERQRAAIKEEERRQQEQLRRREADHQREVQREREQAANLAEAKKSASRQAVEKRRLEMEKAKQTGAPPPAVRPQPNNDLSHGMLLEKPLPSVPPQRGDIGPKVPRMNSTVHRSQDDLGRPVNLVLHNTAKVPPKRPLQQDAGDDLHPRATLQRHPPSYQHNEAHTKRRKTSEAFDEDDLAEPQPKMTAPPIRQSSVRQKDLPTKSLFPSGYANAPQPSNLQKSTLMSQHNMSQSKPAHPMDMAQVSKAPIPFAPSSNQGTLPSHKTPARPGAVPTGIKSTAKSAAKSSPRYQNGENIDLPEIHTDSEDEDSDGGNDFGAVGWANSPDLRKQLAIQERIDPADVFGRPGPLNMEEVFSKSKDRFHKFRARTSSANWSGLDRLTEDEVRRDIEARDRLRRQGGWTYDSMI